MRHTMRVMALMALSATLAAFAPAQEEFNLKMQVKEGDTYKYRFTMELTFGDQSAVITMSMTNKVVKVDTDGNIVIESTSGEGSVKFGDQEMPLPPSPTTKTTYKPNGMPVKVEGGDNPNSPLRMARLTSGVFADKPVKIGDKWSVESKPEGNTPGLKAEYELVGKERVNDIETLKIKLTVKEVGEKVEGGASTMSGHIWLDPLTGMLVRMTATVKGLPAEGAPMPLDGTLTMERIR